MNEMPKYALLEIERRWLVDLSALDLAPLPYREIEDLYISDSRLRLRRIAGPREVVFKLGKKYGKCTPLAEPLTNIYLTESEYSQFADLPGHRTRKRRYSLSGGSLDIYLEPQNELAIFEAEFSDERAASGFVPPPFATREITNDMAFSGATIAARIARASHPVAEDG